jgi:hypothetical protein
MHRGLRVVIMGLVLTVGAASAQAQQPRKVGFVIGYPASVGLLWHVSNGIALRPDITLNRTSTEIASTTIGNIGGVTQSVGTTTEGWTTTFGLSALFYLGSSQEALRFYLVPRVAYGWSNTTTESAPPLPQLGSSESDLDAFAVSGSVGAQYAVHERFRLFGEAGLSYTTQDSDTGYSLSRSRLESTSIGLRSGVGVVVLF